MDLDILLFSESYKDLLYSTVFRVYIKCSNRHNDYCTYYYVYDYVLNNNKSFFFLVSAPREAN